MKNIELYIGYVKKEKFIFDEEEILNLKVKFCYDLYINKQNKRDYTIIKIFFIYKDRDKYYKKSLSEKIINNNDKEIIEKLLTKIKDNYNIITGIIELKALEIKCMTDEELSFFTYIPNIVKYEDNKIPFDAYYIGFWLGDGHTKIPNMFTCGIEDQKYIIPYIEKNISNKINYKLNKVKDEKGGLTFSITQGIEGKGTLTGEENFFKEDWLDDIYTSCKKIELSKNSKTSHNNFRDLFKSKYMKNDNFFCNEINEKKQIKILAKKENTENWLEFENMKEAIANTDCKESTIYKSIRENIYINGWIYKKYIKKIKQKCSYDTAKIKERKNRNIKQARFDAMKEHLRKTHNIKIETPNEAWDNLTEQEKNQYKTVKDKKDICKESKYGDHVSLWKYYKIYEKNGKNGLINHIEEKRKNIHQINSIFRQLNLTNNKHIPEIYLKTSIENRKKLLAGLIDSDGTSGGKSKGNQCWDIIQKNKIIIDHIEILSKSLGMFTRRTEKICKAKKPDGTYSKPILCYRITITPINNWDIPVLLNRKKISEEPHKNGNNGYLTIHKNSSNYTEWTEEKKIILYSVIVRIKKLTSDANIPWKTLYKYDNRLNNISISSLRGMYYETLKKNKEYYDKKIIIFDFELLLDDDKFLNNYEEIKNIFIAGKNINEKPYLVNWLNSWKNNKEFKNKHKKSMINELIKLKK